MYASVRTYAGSTMADALVEHADAVKALIAGIEGFRAYYVIRTGDTTVTVSVFEREAAAAESNAVAAAWIKANLPELSGSSPAVSAGDVVISA